MKRDHGRFQKGPLIPLGYQMGQYRHTEKNILRTENKWCTVLHTVDSGAAAGVALSGVESEAI
jgi:hypothetical protein